MKKALLITVVIMTAMGVFCADKAAERAAAEKLLSLMEVDKTMENTMEQAMNMPLAMIEQQNLTEEQKEEARASIEASMKVTKEKFAWKNLKKMFIDIYAEVLTVEELNGLIKFYESPIGQAYIKKQPQLTTLTMQKMQKLMGEAMPAIQKEVAESIEAARAAKFPEEAEKK